MALQFTVGRAVFDGLIRERLPFVRTAKGAGKSWSSGFPAFWEAILGGLLLLGSLLLYVMNDQRVREISIFSIVLLVQSLPFLAAVGHFPARAISAKCLRGVAEMEHSPDDHPKTPAGNRRPTACDALRGGSL